MVKRLFSAACAANRTKIMKKKFLSLEISLSSEDSLVRLALTDHETEIFFFITPKIVYDPKVEMEQIRCEELKKRPGDIPEFLVRVDEAREKTAKKFFKHSLKTFFTHER